MCYHRYIRFFTNIIRTPIAGFSRVSFPWCMLGPCTPDRIPGVSLWQVDRQMERQKKEKKESGWFGGWFGGGSKTDTTADEADIGMLMITFYII